MRSKGLTNAVLWLTIGVIVVLVALVVRESHGAPGEIPIWESLVIYWIPLLLLLGFWALVGSQSLWRTDSRGMKSDKWIQRRYRAQTCRRVGHGIMLLSGINLFVLFLNWNFRYVNDHRLWIQVTGFSLGLILSLQGGRTLKGLSENHGT
jgi:hypothetical protein